ncbi:hypothetical protein [Lysinibacillus sp. NPDC056185]|uniref:hypothetical protein n=1 Tax=Lysinibacillus sp. NPDC056185 TaxID=3345739 RepID=UPI0039EE94DE
MQTSLSRRLLRAYGKAYPAALIWLPDSVILSQGGAVAITDAAASAVGAFIAAVMLSA